MSESPGDLLGYINSTIEEKNAIIKKIKELRRSLIDCYDGFASPNEDIFYFAKIRLDQLEKEILNFNCRMWNNSKNWIKPGKIQKSDFKT